MGIHPLLHIMLGAVLLLCATYQSAAAASTVRTVSADQEQCGGTLVVGDKVDTYRLIMPNSSDSLYTCPQSNSSFDCTINFQLPKHFFNRRSYDQRKLCVDFARLRLTGNETKLFVTRSGHQSVRLSSSFYPLVERYLTPVRCFKFRTSTPLKLRFQSSCDQDLRRSFISWLYIYHQPDKQIYHIDGTCRQKSTTSRSNMVTTIRSYIWHDTALEPDLQTCSLEVGTNSFYGITEKAFVCPKWNFQHKPCELSAHVKGTYSLRYVNEVDFSKSKNVSCSEGSSYAIMNDCINLSVIFSALFGVRRNKSISDVGQIPDGALFFEVEAETEIQKDEPYDSGDGDNSYTKYNSGSGYSDSSDNNSNHYFDAALFVKLGVPLAGLLCVCCCLCGVHSRKKKRNEQLQCGVSAAGGNTAIGIRTAEQTEQMRLVPQAERVGNEPRGTGYIPNRPYSRRAGNTNDQDPGRDGVAAPPPAYSDVAAATPPAPSPFGDSTQPFRHRPPTMEPVPSVPPPPISDHLPAAPPAYHELFPSGT